MPYFGTLFCQALDNDFIEGAWSNDPLTMNAFYIGLAITAVIAVCGFLGKKRPVWTLVGIILYCADTVIFVIMSFVLLESVWINLPEFGAHSLPICGMISGWKAQKELAQMIGEECQDPAVLHTTDPEVF